MFLIKYKTILRLTNDVQIDESLSLSVFVLDHNLITTLVGLLGVFQSVVSLLCRGINVLEWQAGVIEEPLSLSTWIGMIRDSHNERLSSICHQVLVSSLDLWHSCGGGSTREYVSCLCCV